MGVYNTRQHYSYLGICWRYSVTVVRRIQEISTNHKVFATLDVNQECQQLPSMGFLKTTLYLHCSNK